MLALVQETKIADGKFLTVKGSDSQPALTGGAVLDVTGVSYNRSAAKQRRMLMASNNTTLTFVTDVRQAVAACECTLCIDQPLSAAPGGPGE
jgi:hypothetical protein